MNGFKTFEIVHAVNDERSQTFEKSRSKRLKNHVQNV
jgi:hypothetical protein